MPDWSWMTCASCSTCLDTSWAWSPTCDNSLWGYIRRLLHDSVTKPPTTTKKRYGLL
jgi:hypothetical protein